MMEKIQWEVKNIDTEESLIRNGYHIKASLIGFAPRGYGAPSGVDIANDLQKKFSHNDALDAQVYVIRSRTAYNAIRPATGIKQVIFNDPATIVYWTDGTKTVVKAENEPFDREKGLAMAISKKALGNQGNYFEVFKKYIKEDSNENT